ncbi:hypothetical protein EMCRGX_G013819 [Ephydatia muelleri]
MSGSFSRLQTLVDTAKVGSRKLAGVCLDMSLSAASVLVTASGHVICFIHLMSHMRDSEDLMSWSCPYLSEYHIHLCPTGHSFNHNS